jgi:hypothetical protein
VTFTANNMAQGAVRAEPEVGSHKAEWFVDLGICVELACAYVVDVVAYLRITHKP